MTPLRSPLVAQGRCLHKGGGAIHFLRSVNSAPYRGTQGGGQIANMPMYLKLEAQLRQCVREFKISGDSSV